MISTMATEGSTTIIRGFEIVAGAHSGSAAMDNCLVGFHGIGHALICGKIFC
jgi:hypothetical protein